MEVIWEAKLYSSFDYPLMRRSSPITNGAKSKTNFITKFS